MISFNVQTKNVDLFNLMPTETASKYSSAPVTGHTIANRTPTDLSVDF